MWAVVWVQFSRYRPLVRRQRGPFVDAGSFHAGLTASSAMLLTPHFSAAPLAFSEMNS